MKFIFGVFILLHGLVHLLYAGQSTRYFQLQPGMLWPDGSWVFSRLLGNEVARNLANILLVLVAIGLVVGGIGILASQPWWRPVVVGAALLSSLVYIFFGMGDYRIWMLKEGSAFSLTWQFCSPCCYFDGRPRNEITSA